MAALPLAIVCGERWPANGLPQYVSAMPQYAIAQFGSSFSTPSNMARDSANQNEWRRATAWLNLVFVAGLQEVSKLTVPMSFGAISTMLLVLRKRRLHEPETHATHRNEFSSCSILRANYMRRTVDELYVRTLPEDLPTNI